MFNTQVVEQLPGEPRMRDLPTLTFESGIAYSIAPGQIDPENVLPKVDAIIGLLGRLPGARPASPGGHRLTEATEAGRRPSHGCGDHTGD